MKQKLLLLVCLLSLSISQSQTIFSDGTLSYTITDATNNYVSVTRDVNGQLLCFSGDLVISEIATDPNTSISYTVTAIEGDPFWGCTSLTSVDIPSTVTSIGYYAFGSTGLTSVIVHWDPTPISIPAEVFYNLTTSNMVLTVPAGTAAAYGNDAVWGAFGSTIVLSADDFTANAIDVKLYPNPVHNQLRIDLSSGISIEQVTIYNNLGQLVKKGVSTRIDVSNLNGVYFVEISTNKGKVTRTIIVE